MSLATTITAAARRYGARAAFVPARPAGNPGPSPAGPLTYADLDRLSDEAALGLSDRGIGEGDLVTLLMPSGPDYVVAYAALTKVGAITAGVNPRFTPAERSAVLAVAAPRAVIATEGLAAGVDTGAPVHIVATATDPDLILRELRVGLDHRTPALLDDPENPERPVAVVFTSGTTGTPRGALFTNREVAAVTAADTANRWGGGGHLLAATQFAHVGFMTKLEWYLRLGTTTHVLDRWRAADALDLIEQHRITSIGGIAPQVALMLADPQFDDRDLSCVKSIVMGGAASPPALVREARLRFGAQYSIRYSSTESGGIGLATALNADDDEALYTVGRPRPGVAVSIRDDAGQPVPDGDVGELWLRSPTQMRRYWRDPEATATALVDGWLRTGDRARVDGRGLVHLAGRTTDMFIRGGYNVHPVEVEAVLADHPEVQEVAVVPRPDAVLGEIGVAVVVPADQAQPPDLSELRAFAGARLAHHKLPEALRIVDHLPRTSMDKIDRRALATEPVDPA